MSENRINSEANGLNSKNGLNRKNVSSPSLERHQSVVSCL